MSEGTLAQNIVVRNCEFDTPNSTGIKSDGYEAGIVMGVFMKTYSISTEQTDYPVVKDVLFENNTFKNNFSLIARISATENVVFRNNKFIDTLARKSENDYRACFYVRNSAGVKITDNVWIKSPLVPAPRVMTDYTAKDVYVEGNGIEDDNGKN